MMATLRRKKAVELPNVDLIDIHDFQPSSDCPHGLDVARGQYCPVCHKLKPRNYHIGRRSIATDPKPEPRRTYAPVIPGGLGHTPVAAQPAPLTRREKRAAANARRSQSARTWALDDGDASVDRS
jgi:hypothetical protein